jgi:membrane fusion protein (multidrug efflux system)
MKSVLSIMFTLILLISCSGGEGQKNRGGKENDGKGDKNASKMEKATPVEVVELQTGDIGSYILLNTTVETEQMIDVFAQANGFVQTIHYEEGAFVKEGDILVELDAREVKIRRDKAKINYEQKKREYDRFNKSENKNVLSKEEVEGFKFQYETAKLDYDQAELDYEYSRIKAPISGVVSSREVNIGQRITVGTKVYQVTRLTERIATVQVPEREVNVVKKGQSVKIFSDVILGPNGKPKEFTGSVKRVSPVISPNSGTYKVVIALANTEELKPGMFINVRIQTAVHKNAILVPKATLVYENDSKFVFAVRDSIVRKIDVQPGFEDSYNVETLSDKLKVSDQIVILGQDGLKDETKIKVVKNQSKSDAAIATN